MSEEWDLLKIFADELLAFKEATKIFSQSKAITSPNVTSIFDLLLNQLNTSIIALGNPFSRCDGKANEHRAVNGTERSIYCDENKVT